MSQVYVPHPDVPAELQLSIQDLVKHVLTLNLPESDRTVLFDKIYKLIDTVVDAVSTTDT